MKLVDANANLQRLHPVHIMQQMADAAAAKFIIQNGEKTRF